MLMCTWEKHTKLHAQSVTLYSMHGCANSQDEFSLTLSVENWVNNVCYCPYHSHTLHFISNTPKYISVIQEFSIHQKLPLQQHSLQPRSVAETPTFPYAPYMLICAKEWCHPEEPKMSSKCRHRGKNGQEHITRHYQFLVLSPSKWTIHIHKWQSESKIHLHHCWKRYAIPLCRTYSCTIFANDANCTLHSPKVMPWTTIFVLT